MGKETWHDNIRYRLNWTLPDGRPAGMVWRLGTQSMETLTFDGENITFRNVVGKPVEFPRVGTSSFRVCTDEAPLYFIGGGLVK